MSKNLINISVEVAPVSDLYMGGYTLAVIAGGVYTGYTFARDELKSHGDTVKVGEVARSGVSGFLLGSFVWSILGTVWPVTLPWAVAELTIFQMEVTNPLKK
jgi:hypothetical protein